MRYLFAMLALCLNATAAHAAPDMFDAARKGDAAAIVAYHQAGGDLEMRTGRGYTPFILAAYHGKLAALKALKKEGAELCALDEAGNTALMGAAYQGHVTTVEWLVKETPCDVNQQNTAGQTALMMASLFGREAVIDTLLKHGADPKLEDHRGNTARSLAEMQGLEKVVQKLTFPLRKK